MSNCSSNTSGSEANADSVISVDDAQMDNAPPSPGNLEVSLQKIQTELDTLLNGFTSRTNVSTLVFTSEHNIGGSVDEYYFDENFTIRYKNSSVTEEGGYLESCLKEYQNEHVIRCLKQIQGGFSDFNAFGFYTDGHLTLASVMAESYIKDGRGDYIYKISGEALPEKADTADMMNDFDAAHDKHFRSVLANLERFNLFKGSYEFYAKRDTAEGENGEQVASFELYRIDSTLFVNKFRKN